MNLRTAVIINNTERETIGETVMFASNRSKREVIIVQADNSAGRLVTLGPIPDGMTKWERAFSYLLSEGITQFTEEEQATVLAVHDLRQLTGEAAPIMLTHRVMPQLTAPPAEQIVGHVFARLLGSITKSLRAKGNPMRLKDKVSIVTGASRGIGRAIALGLAREGAEVVISYQGNAKAAGDTVNTIIEAGGCAHAIQADGGDLDQISRFFAEVTAIAPQIDILVNNVGSASVGPQPLGTVDVIEYERLFSLNTRGLFFTSQEALKLMRDGGRIVNISSLSSRMTAPGRSVYAGTKGAIEAFTRVWAAELGCRGITVNSVSPGTVETDRLKEQLSPETRDTFVKMTPLARIGQPDDIAGIVVFLCSEEGRWLTAQNLIASGGLS